MYYSENVIINLKLFNLKILFIEFDWAIDSI